MTMVEGLDDEPDLFAVAQQLPEPSDLIDSDDDAPIIRLINALLTQAVKDGASDIHIEPYREPTRCAISYRRRHEGSLQSRRAVAPIVVSRIKVMSKLDIAEKRMPQDGRISAANRRTRRRRARIDTCRRPRRASRIALARQTGRAPGSDHLGMAENQRKIDDSFIEPHGILLVTGPTGSGKTTTLYAALERINDNVATS